MPCLEYLELMNAVLDGEASAEEARALESHLSECPDCRALFADLSALHGGADALVTEAPAGFTDRVMEAVRAEQAPTVVPIQSRPRRWRSLAALAAVCAVALLGSGSLRYLQQHAAAGPQPAAESSLTTPVESAPSPAPEFLSPESPTARRAQMPGPSAVQALPPSDVPSAAPAEADPESAPGGEAFRTAPPAAAPAPNIALFHADPEPDAMEDRLLLPPENDSVRQTITPLEAMGLVVEQIGADAGCTPEAANTSQGENISCLLRLDGEAFPLSYAGLSEDGTCYRFLFRDTVYTVFPDGSQVLREPPAGE